MTKIRAQRNWSDYNQKLQKIASIDFFISPECLDSWYFSGSRKPGGKVIFSDHAIELCLLMSTFYDLPLRQTQGFMASLFAKMNVSLPVPDYSTIGRRARTLSVDLAVKAKKLLSLSSPVVAIDSTGLSLYDRSEWHRLKQGRYTPRNHEKWRKLHLIIDVKTGDILESEYTFANHNDGPVLPGLLQKVPQKIEALCGDMAYDQVKCRKALFERGIRQMIPPINPARLAHETRNAAIKDVLKERDDAILFIRYNSINGETSWARKSWKEKIGYHQRSLIETTMSQIKRHCSDHLRNKREDTRNTQARIKCKIINMINAA